MHDQESFNELEEFESVLDVVKQIGNPDLDVFESMDDWNSECDF